MKRTISFVIAIILLFSLGGCGSNNESMPETTRSPYYDESMPNKLLSSTLENFPKATEDMSRPYRRMYMC